MLKVRLARYGSKNRPFYRIILAEASASRNGAFIEKLGTYNPLLSESSQNKITLKVERILYWIARGAQPTNKVAYILHINKNIQYTSKKFQLYDALRVAKRKTR